MTVFTCYFFNWEEVRLAKDRETAYKILREYIEEIVKDYEDRNGCLKELSIDYLTYPDSFGCEGVCWAMATEVE